MYITSVPNRNSRPAILLRESYRENGKVKNRTIANLTDWDPALVEAFKALLAAKKAPGPLAPFHVVRALPHGHVAAVLGVAHDIGLPALLSARNSRERSLAIALIVQRVLDPASKLSSSRALSEATASSSLGEVLGLGASVSADDLYGAMDWLQRRQAGIEKRLARKHLEEGCVVLYDLTSAWVEGSKCELAKRGYSRDGKAGKDQIEFGLVTDTDGRPIAVEVYEGNVADPATVPDLVRKVRERFGLSRVILVGDRGMLTGARIREDIEPEVGLEFVTGLRKPSIRKLLDQGAIQLGLFDDRNLVEIESDEFPGSRLIVCCNPFEKQAQRERRQIRVNRAVTALSRVREAVNREQRPLRGEEAIAMRVGKVFGRHRGTQQYFKCEIGDDSFQYQVDEAALDSEGRMDGIYVVRTSVEKAQLGAEAAVRLYKSLSKVERSFRAMKSADIEVRPIFHRRADRVRAHVLLCTLALYLRRELEMRLAPLLYVQGEVDASEDARKPGRHETADGFPRQAFPQLLRSLATLTRNLVKIDQGVTDGFWTTAKPTPLQSRAFELLGVEP